jgi:hypothetical protein
MNKRLHKDFRRYNMNIVKLEAGLQTEELWQFIIENLNDSELDAIDVEREYAPAEGLANEPITTAIVLTLSTTALLTLGRIIEKWIENKRQEQHIRAVLKGFKESDDAGRAMLELAKRHGNISITFGIPHVEN